MIEKIKESIAAAKKQCDNIRLEKERMEPLLSASRYIDQSILSLIRSRYNDKISRLDRDIADMQAHLKELEASTDEK